MKKSVKYLSVAVAGAAVLGWNTIGQVYMVNQKVAPVSAYFTSSEIKAGTIITEDMLNEREVPSAALPPNVITNKEEIVGHYVKHGYNIPVNSYFFDDVVLEEKEMPNASVLKLKEGEKAFPLLVDLETSLGNGIVPDTRVDLAFRTTVYNQETQLEEPIFGILAENVRVTSVKDSNAASVFNEDGKNKNNETESLSKLYTFAVNEELNEVLNKAILLGEVRPIAKGEVIAETTLPANEVFEWIESNSYKFEANLLSAEKQKEIAKAEEANNLTNNND